MRLLMRHRFRFVNSISGPILSSEVRGGSVPVYRPVQSLPLPRE